MHTVKNMKIKTLLTQKPLEIDQKFQQIWIPQIVFYTLLKFGQPWCQNKRTLLKKLKKIQSRISLFFILKKKKKSGILFLPFYTFPASFSKIGRKKWLSALMG